MAGTVGMVGMVGMVEATTARKAHAPLEASVGSATGLEETAATRASGDRSMAVVAMVVATAEAVPVAGAVVVGDDSNQRRFRSEISGGTIFAR
jgi:hypothetical protein